MLQQQHHVNQLFLYKLSTTFTVRFLLVRTSSYGKISSKNKRGTKGWRTHCMLDRLDTNRCALSAHAPPAVRGRRSWSLDDQKKSMGALSFNLLAVVSGTSVCSNHFFHNNLQNREQLVSTCKESSVVWSCDLYRRTLFPLLSSLCNRGTTEWTQSATNHHFVKRFLHFPSSSSSKPFHSPRKKNPLLPPPPNPLYSLHC